MIVGLDGRNAVWNLIPRRDMFDGMALFRRLLGSHLSRTKLRWWE